MYIYRYVLYSVSAAAVLDRGALETKEANMILTVVRRNITLYIII